MSRDIPHTFHLPRGDIGTTVRSKCSEAPITDMKAVANINDPGSLSDERTDVTNQGLVSDFSVVLGEILRLEEVG